MPKRSTEAYESDGGFVEDVPTSKKSRKANDTKRREGKQEVDLSMQEDDNGDPYWEARNDILKRRVLTDVRAVVQDEESNHIKFQGQANGQHSRILHKCRRQRITWQEGLLGPIPQLLSFHL